MKMQSYLSVNGNLQQTAIQSEILLEELQRATQPVGGWDEALKAAKARHDEMDASLGLDILSPDSTTPCSTPGVPEGLTTSYTDATTATVLRQRLAAVSLATEGNIAVINASKAKVVPEKKPAVGNTQPYLRQPHPLVDHYDKKIAEMAMDYSDLQSELTSQGPECVTWPNNITIRDFARFHLFPTLVYELEYPRTDR